MSGSTRSSRKNKDDAVRQKCEPNPSLSLESYGARGTSLDPTIHPTILDRMEKTAGLLSGLASSEKLIDLHGLEMRIT